MKVKNATGTSELSCSCGSWLAHWEKFSGQTTEFCQAIGCIKRDVVGAHVQRTDVYDFTSYIYPLCNACNQSEQTLEVSDSYKLVKANKAETCEKSKPGLSGISGLLGGSFY
jgi:hypothetical protein